MHARYRVLLVVAVAVFVWMTPLVFATGDPAEPPLVARKHWLRRCASLAVSAPILCKEASCFEADAVPCTLTSTSYNL